MEKNEDKSSEPKVEPQMGRLQILGFQFIRNILSFSLHFLYVPVTRAQKKNQIQKEFFVEAYACIDCKVLLERVENFKKLDQNIFDLGVVDQPQDVDQLHDVETSTSASGANLADSNNTSTTSFSAIQSIPSFNPFLRTKNLPFGPCRRRSIQKP